MRRITFLLAAILGLTFSVGCEGPEGPRGPQGQNGTNILSEVFEISGSFNSTNDYTISYALNPNIYPEDTILVYELTGVFNGKDIWSPLPTQYYFNGGDLRYYFDFTKSDIQIYLDTDIPMNEIPDQYRFNKVFRIVVVPGYFSLDGIDTNNLDAVLGAISLSENSVQIID